MTQALCITRVLTGRRRIVPGFLGPKVMVEERVRAWDTNTGRDEPDRLQWRKAANKDLFQADLEEWS